MNNNSTNKKIAYFRITDVHEPFTFGVEYDVDEYSQLFAMIIADIPNWEHGNQPQKYTFYYPENVNITNNRVAFPSAIQNHSNDNPILLKTNREIGFGDLIRSRPPNSDLIVLNKYGRRLNNFFRIERSELVILPDSPYRNDTKFGDYILGGPRTGHVMDHQFIDLGHFAPHLRSAFVAIIIAKIYAALFAHDNTDVHPICSYLKAKIFSKVYRRMGDSNNSVNVVVAPTQSGKSKELLATAVMNLFLARDSLVFVRNYSGNQSMSTFGADFKNFDKLARDYVENVLDIDMNACNDLFDSVTVYDGVTNRLRNGDVQRPFIYLERTNPTKIEFPIQNFYNPIARDKYSLFIDEEDEQCQLRNAMEGTMERLLYCTPRANLEGNAIFNDSHMNVSFTATPSPLLTSKPNCDNNNYQFNVIDVPPSSNYKGHESRLSSENRIVLVRTDRKKIIYPTERQQLSSFELTLRSNEGIRLMLDDMKNMHNDHEDNHPHLSALITCSSISKNVNKQLAKGIISLLRGIPAVTFSHDMDSVLTIYFDVDKYFTDVSEKLLTDMLDKCFDGTNPRYAKKLIAFCYVEKTYDSFVIAFKKREDETVHVAYDIVQILYELQHQIDQVNLKPFVVCSSLILANRGDTFKTSNHEMVLTHQYASEKSLTNMYGVDIKQNAGLICGVDNYDFKRYLYAPNKYLEMLEMSYGVDTDLIEAYGDTLKTFEDAMLDVLPDSTLGKVMHHKENSKMVKRKHNE